MATRIGYGQVEPNHLSAQRTGQIYAQLPAAASINMLENGQFVKYDYATNGGEVNFTGKGEWMLVYNEEKLYDERQQAHKDFAMIKTNYTQGGDVTHDGLGPFKGQMVPRVLKTNVGDIFTTNCIEKASEGGPNGTTTFTELNLNDEVAPDTSTGYLSTSGDVTNIKFQVVKVTTMPDGQVGYKLMRIL